MSAPEFVEFLVEHLSPPFTLVRLIDEQFVVVPQLHFERVVVHLQRRGLKSQLSSSFLLCILGETGLTMALMTSVP